MDLDKITKRMIGMMRDEIFQRIMLSKTLLKSAEGYCINNNDRLIFSKGLILLQDAVEACFGAIGDHLHISFTGKNLYLLDYYDLIEKQDPTRKVPYRIQMRNLNTIRNNIKHNGILPDPASNAHFPAICRSLIEEVCLTYLDIELNEINLLSLIRDQRIKSLIIEANEHFFAEEFEKSLISLAYAMHYICETGTFPFMSKKEIVFSKYSTTEHSLKLLENKVDPFTYHRFKNLTPRLAKDKESKDLLYWWDKHYGHSANWTYKNTKFCLEFCIDTALKFQRDDNNEYDLIPYYKIFEDVIEANEEEVIVWNRSIHPPEFQIGNTPERKPIMILKSGGKLTGWATDSEDLLDEWFIMSSDLPSDNPNSDGFGYVSKEDVIVTQVKIERM